MEKIEKQNLADIPTLAKLHDNWQQWGQDYKLFLENNKKQGKEKIGQDT